MAGWAQSARGEMRSSGMKTIIVQPSPFTYRHRNQIIELLTNQGLAMICAWPPGPSEGALIGYGPDYSDIYRRAGSYISRVLKVKIQLPFQFKTRSSSNL